MFRMSPRTRFVDVWLGPTVGLDVMYTKTYLQWASGTLDFRQPPGINEIFALLECNEALIAR